MFNKGKIFLKRVLAVILTVCVIIPLLPGPSIKVSANPSDFEYTDNPDGTVTVTKYNGSDTTISIPSTSPAGKTVTKIGASAFADRLTLTNVVMPDTITEIGYQAFSSCSSLESITLSNQLETIGEQAFNCCGLETITLPASLRAIGTQAFRGGNIAVLTIPEGVTTIGDKAFEAADLESITIPASVTAVGELAFFNCGDITAIEVNDLNTNYCDIDGVLFNKSKTELIWYPYARTAATYTIPDTVQTVGIRAFDGAYAMTEIFFPESVTSIGEGAFYGLYNDLNAYFYGAAPSFGTNAFDGSLTTVYYRTEHGSTFIGKAGWSDCTLKAWVTDATEFTYADNPDGTVTVTKYNGSDTVISIPSTSPAGKTVTKLGYAAFDSEAFTGVIIPDTITEIGAHAFIACRQLAGITIPDSVATIGDAAFCYCDSLRTVQLPVGLEVIGPSVFCECYSLTDIALPATLRELGDQAFQGCDGFTSIAIPSGVSIMGNSVFKECENLETVNIPADLTSMGGNCFSGCPVLQDVTIEPGAGLLGDNTFYECPDLVNITIPDSVESIGICVFYGTGITNINIPAALTTLADYALYGCPELTTITVDASNPDYSAVNGVLYKDNETVLVQYPSGNTAAEFIVPDGIAAIGTGALGSPLYLTKVIVPSTVTNIGDYGFDTDSAIVASPVLTELYFKGAAPATGAEVFYGSSITVYCKAADRGSYTLTGGKWNGCTLLEWSEAAAGLTASVAPKATPESGKVMLTVTPGASDGSHKIYYRVVSSDPTAMEVGDILSVSAWTEVVGTAAQEISTVNGNYIETVEITTSDSRVTKWGKSAATNDGYVPPVAATGMGTSVAPKLMPESGRIMLGVAPAASDANHKVYYRVVSSDPAGKYVGDVIDISAWVEVTGTDPQEIGAVNGSYIEAVEVTIADSRVTKWGKSAATNDGYVPLSAAAGIAVSVSPKAIPESNKVVLAATSSAIVANSRLLYRVTASDPAAPNVGDTITISEWIPVIDTNAMEISAVNGSYIEVVEITTSDSKITQWGKSGRIADGYTAPPPQITPDAPTNPIQNDTNNTFGWTFVPGYNLISDYEYSLNGGSTWTAAAANPLNLSNQAYQAGAVQVRVKADSLSNRTPGLVLSSTTAYTVASSSDSNGGSNNSGTNPNPPPSPNTGGTIRQVEVKVGNDTSSTASSQIDIIRTTENNQKKDSVVLNDEKTDEVLKKAVEQNKDNVTIIINDVPDDKADEVSVSVTNSSIGKLANNNTSLEIKTEQVTIELPKETVRALSGREEDLYFRVVPVKSEAEKQEAVKNTIQASIVKDTADGDEVAVYGTPMTIETNYQNQTTKVTFSLKDIPIPAESAAREEFLNNLAIFIQHSDGEEVLDRGTIKYDSLGNPVGIEIVLTKFSTFTIIAVGNVAPLAVNVAISGSTQVGKKLTARYTYSDLDNDPQGKSTIKWYRADSAKDKNKKVITGATKLTYTITEKDKGKFIIFEITPKAKTGTIKGNVVTAATKTVIKKTTAKPANKKEEAKNSAKLKLGTVSDKKYADTLSDRLKNTYGGKNVAIVKEGKYYRVSANFADKTKAKAAAEDMKKKKLIINYSIK